MVGSMGGAPKHPEWYLNLKADPDALMVQDGADRFDASARELSGEEREIWWQRAVQAYPSYAKYQEKTDREIPVLLLNGGADRQSGGCGAFLRTSARTDAHNAENSDIRGRGRRNVTADVGSRLELLTPCL